MVRVSRPGHCRTVPDYGEGLGANPAVAVGRSQSVLCNRWPAGISAGWAKAVPVSPSRGRAIGGIGTDPNHGGSSSADDAIQPVCGRAHLRSRTRRLAYKPDPGTGDLAHSQTLPGHKNRAMTEHYVRSHTPDLENIFWRRFLVMDATPGIYPGAVPVSLVHAGQGVSA